ncbi:MAG: 2-phospho-L-lactate guanylyltransferase [Acidimicrobiales bacterium]|nr:2-phospho-L-lactate guanylyltransferase [Acidimicrobiales bacterium]
MSNASLGTIVLIPIRSFDDMKTRLAGALDLDQRRRLAIWMAERVVAAADPFPTMIVTDDLEVAEWAQATRAGVLDPGVRGLNPCVTAAVAAVAADGHERAIIAHADLPAAASLAPLDGDGVLIAPDRARDGSNVLSVPTRAGFVFQYGPGSFAAHQAEAERCGLGLTVVDDPDLAWDVDDPADLPAEWRAVVEQEAR